MKSFNAVDVTLAVLAASLIFATVGFLCGLAAAATHDSQKIELEYREQAAVKMIQMGYDRWVVACAIAMTKDGRAKDADRLCRVDFGLPPL